MAGADVTAVIEAVLKSDQFTAGLKKLTDETKKSEKEAGGFFEKFNDPSSIAKGIFGVAAYEAIKKVGEAIFDAAKEAGEFIKLNEAFDSLFQGMGDEADKMRQRLATDLNLSTEEVTKLINGIQKVQLGLGLGAEEAAKFTEESLRVAKALQEFGTGSVQGNMEALQTAFLGQTRGLRQLGVQLSETDILARAQAKGFEVLNGKISQSARETIILEAVMKANKGAMENSKKESMSFSETIELITAKAKDMKLAFGIEMQNTLKGGSDAFVPFIKTVATLENMRIAVAGFFEVLKLGASVAIFPIRQMFSVFETAGRGIFAVVNFVKDVVTQGFSKAFSNAWESVKQFADNLKRMATDMGYVIYHLGASIKDALGGNIEGAKKNLESMRGAIGNMGKDLKNITPGGLGSVSDVFERFTKILNLSANDLDKIKTEGSAAGQALTEGFANANITLEQSRALAASYYDYIDEKMKAQTIKAEDERKKQLDGIKSLYQSGYITKQEADARTARAEVAFQKQLSKIKIDAAKEVADKINQIVDQAAKISYNLVKLGQLKEQQAYQETVDKLRELEDTQANIQRGRREEDYADNLAKLTQEYNDAVAAGDMTLAKEKERSIIRLNQDHDYAVQKDALEQDAAKKERKLKHDAAVADKIIKLASAGISVSQAVIGGAAALPIPPFPFAIAAGALGATELALIAAQEIPALASGGISAGGLSLVGEKGPELRILGRGDTIIPADKTARMLANLPSATNNSSSYNDARSVTTKNDNRVFSLTAHGIQDPMKFINDAKRKLGTDVFVRK